MKYGRGSESRRPPVITAHGTEAFYPSPERTGTTLFPDRRHIRHRGKYFSAVILYYANPPFLSRPFFFSSLSPCPSTPLSYTSPFPQCAFHDVQH